MRDASCSATVLCQYNCYNANTGTAAQTCADACAGTSSSLFVGYSACNGTTCETACQCP
jgi:hypothetical protein